MATRPRLRWKRIVLTAVLLVPVALIADLSFFQLKHQALIWANGGRWCADVDEASGEVLERHYGDAACKLGGNAGTDLTDNSHKVTRSLN